MIRVLLLKHLTVSNAKKEENTEKLLRIIVPYLGFILDLEESFICENISFEYYPIGLTPVSSWKTIYPTFTQVAVRYIGFTNASLIVS